MAKKSVRVAVVGAGAAAQISHIPAYRKLKDVEVVAVCDRDVSRRLAVSHKFGIPEAFEDFQDLLRADHLDIDAIDICAPTHLHGAMALAALSYGKHVLVERPFVTKTSEAEALVAAAAKADRIVMVAMNHRYRPDAQTLWQFIQKKEIGPVYFAKAGYLRGRDTWQTGAQGGRGFDVVAGQRGVLLDLGLQMLDLALWLTGGSVVSVSASMHASDKGKAEDSAVGFVRLDTGATITLDVSWGLLQDKDFAFVNLFGPKGTALFNPLRLLKSLHGNLVNVTPTAATERNHYKKSYEVEIEHFVDCVRRNVQPASTAEEALTLMRVVDALYKSADTGKEVRLA